MNNISIYGSTGTIGSKSLEIIKNFFPHLKINILVANKNYKKLAIQAKIFKPKYICITDDTKFNYLTKELFYHRIKIIKSEDLNKFIKSTKSDLSILCISGYSALNYLSAIIMNTNYLGLVNKESVVSAGHLINKICLKFNTNLIPLDSEHYSIYNYIKKNKYNDLSKTIKKVYLTASGGPFLNRKYSDLKKVSFKKAIQHPKWKMGIKNSLDSATLVNKCLEIIEAHYLFNINYNKLDILIHPEALVHSVIENSNNLSIMNYFYHDMSIPIYNFLNINEKNNKMNLPKFNFKNYLSLNFSKPKIQNFPILKLFNKIDKKKPANLIKFNTANEFAVNLFRKNMIIFSDINKIIEKSLSIDVNIPTNSVKNVIIYQEKFMNKLNSKFSNMVDIKE